MKKLSKIPEALYLTVENCDQYRTIMRIFLNEYDKMRFQLDKEMLYKILVGLEGFDNYSLDQLKANLDVLVNNGNLIAIQDSKKVLTISDYKNKQFNYSMSEKAVEIERMTLKLENMSVEISSLSTNTFIRINDSLTKAKSLSKSSLKYINEWWHSLQEDFKRINENYKDYLREFYSGEADNILKSLEFIKYKDLFISYLKDFIKELQINSTKTEEILKSILDVVEKDILDLVVKSELEIPHTITKDREFLKSRIEENVWGKWSYFKDWFINTSNKPSECNKILDITDEVIRKIVNNAILIMHSQNIGTNRKSDYKKFISLFLKCEDLDEAHKLSAHVFGVENIRHYKVNKERETESINNSVYDENPFNYIFTPHIRNYKPKITKEGFKIKSDEKKLFREHYLEDLNREKEMVLKYIKNNELDISKIDECISKKTRETLLKWISIANSKAEKSGITEYGQKYRLIRKNEECILSCEDGTLKMPIYIIKFKE